jgi:hypothetical protein
VKQRRLLLAWLGGLAVALMLAVNSADAQEPRQAGLVVAFGDGSAETRCVTLDEPTVTGYELLASSGLALDIDAQGMGVAVCGIEGAGCPANDCFCECKGGDQCNYWSYWSRNDGEWRYSQAGAGREIVEPGDVQGWSWGAGSVTEAEAPPELTYEAICTVDGAEAHGSVLSDGSSSIHSVPTWSLTDWVPYMGFVAIMGVLGGGYLLLMRRPA